jgi:hypothetical protein
MVYLQYKIYLICMYIYEDSLGSGNCEETMTVCVQSIQLNLLNTQPLPRSDDLVKCCFQTRRFHLYLAQLYRFPIKWSLLTALRPSQYLG